MDNIWVIAAIWMGTALLASFISIRLGISVALVEIALGVIGGNYFGFHTTPWIDFLAGFGSVLLTFLAGAEIDPDSFRKQLKPSFAIGSVSFLFPFLAAMAFALFVAHWDVTCRRDCRHCLVYHVCRSRLCRHDRDGSQ